MRLFDPRRHERLNAEQWSEDAARRAIETIVRDCEDRFSPEGRWPPHPLDLDGRRPAEPFTMLYDGAAGVIFALDFLARRGLARPPTRFASVLASLEERNREQIGALESFLMGRSGILLTQYRMRPSGDITDRMASSVAANAGYPSREFLWGAPGTMHVALAMHESTGEERWAEPFRSSAKALERNLIEAPGGCQLWDQHLGRRRTYLGAGHGFAGNGSAILRGLELFAPQERAEWIERIVTATLATVVRDSALANWPTGWSELRHDFLVQWCHGAPGFVTSLASLADPRLDDVLIAAGELIWAAGPLTKGAGLCHGTAGNGFAFLKLFRRTSDVRWLERARAFAMHGVAQSERHAATYGMRRYSLYTGDPGLAIYLARCIDGADGWPGLDPER
jgi:hypothetical protein